MNVTATEPNTTSTCAAELGIGARDQAVGPNIVCKVGFDVPKSEPRRSDQAQRRQWAPHSLPSPDPANAAEKAELPPGSPLAALSDTAKLVKQPALPSIFRPRIVGKPFVVPGSRPPRSGQQDDP